LSDKEFKPDRAVRLNDSMSFAALRNEKEFKPNYRWFDRWKSRYKISFQAMNGESAKVNMSTVKE
jgi:hypothetical protein